MKTTIHLLLVAILVLPASKLFAEATIDPTISANNKINIAGRQRMLTQRAAKQFCYVLSGIEPSQNSAALVGTMDLFEQSVYGLTFGSDSLNLRQPVAQ